MLSEAFAYHEKNLQSQPHNFGEIVRARFQMGGLFTSADYIQAQRAYDAYSSYCHPMVQVLYAFTLQLTAAGGLYLRLRVGLLQKLNARSIGLHVGQSLVLADKLHDAFSGGGDLQEHLSRSLKPSITYSSP